MIGLFYDSGIWMQTGMGGVALTWTEIRNWLDCAELSLSYWEVATIRAMSNAYVREFSNASEEMREAPYSRLESVVNNDAVADKAKSLFRSWTKRE